MAWQDKPMSLKRRNVRKDRHTKNAERDTYLGQQKCRSLQWGMIDRRSPSHVRFPKSLMELFVVFTSMPFSISVMRL